MTSSTCAACGSDASLSAFIELRGLRPESCPHDPPCAATGCPRLAVGIRACLGCLDAGKPAVSEAELLSPENERWLSSVLRANGLGSVRRDQMRLVWLARFLH